MSLTARAVLGVLLVAVVSSCGGGSNESGAPATVTGVQTGVTNGVTETPPLSDVEAKELAASMNLRLTDFPPGWRAGPSAGEGERSGVQSLREKYDLLARESSRNFAHGDITSTSSTANLFNDQATARDALNYVEGSIQSDEFRDCFGDGIRESVEAGVTIGEITVGQVSFPSLGQRSSAWEVVIPIEAEGTSASAYLDVVFIVQGNAMASVDFYDLEPFDEQQREHLAGLVAERIQSALGAEGS